MPTSKGDAIDAIADAAASAEDAPDLIPAGDQVRHDRADHDYVLAELPDDCPVQVLGHHKKINWVLDHAGQLVELSPKCEKGELMQIFGARMGWLIDVFPQYGQAKGSGRAECVGFNQKRVQEAMIDKASRMGIFDPTGRVRGRGAHVGPAGELYMHSGDQVLVSGLRSQRQKDVIIKSVVKPTGRIGRLVFPTEPAISPLADDPAPILTGQRVLTLLRTWNWKDGFHADLVFAWFASSMLGGALAHRPSLWVTGPSGAGKTSLQQVLRMLMGDWAIPTEDATEAGVRQLLNQDTLAVMFDEIEPDESNAPVHMKIIKLARLSYSGGGALRGSTDHKSKSFTARSSFMFSSINHHQLPAQDRNRMAIVALKPFPIGAVQPDFPPALEQWGAAMRRRLAEQWHRYRPTLEAYARALLREGFSGREQDTYATLLACSDLLLHDATPDWCDAEMAGETCRTVQAAIALAGIINLSRAETIDATERCLSHLSSKRLPSSGGRDQISVSVWIARALIEIINKDSKRPAADKLLSHGMKLVHAPVDGEGAGVEAREASKPIHVAVASATHAGMTELFKDTLWEKGIWPQSLALEPGALPGRNARFGRSHRCTLIPISAMIDVELAQDDAAAERAGRL